MSDRTLRFGIVGLGKIGGSLALQALEEDMQVVGYARSGARKELTDAGLISAADLRHFKTELPTPRIVFIYVPAGSAVDEVLRGLAKELEPGDIVADGGNSYWGDSLRRFRKLNDQGIRFVDLGTSGGVEGARHGACFMAGGKQDAVETIEPILKRLAVDGGYVHAGPPGAGHFVKLVHNGIEFGTLQAIGEGIALLAGYREKLDIAEVLRCWRHGSVIRSWLIDLMERSYREHGGLKPIPPYVEDTGEVNWLVEDALQMEVPIPVTAQAVMQLLQSRDENEPWARAIAMMRHEFGGHPFGEDESIARERQEGRVSSQPKSKGS